MLHASITQSVNIVTNEPQRHEHALIALIKKLNREKLRQHLIQVITCDPYLSSMMNNFYNDISYLLYPQLLPFFVQQAFPVSHMLDILVPYSQSISCS